MLPYIITQLFPNVKFFPAQGGSYKEILHFVHCLAHFAYRSMWRFGTMSKTYSRMKIIPPHQSLTRQLPPEGKPSLRCANMANGCASTANKKAEKPVELQEQTGLCFLAYPTCYGKRKAFRKRLPLGGKKTASSLSRKRLMRGINLRSHRNKSTSIFSPEAERHMGRSLQRRAFDGLRILAFALCRVIIRRERPACRSALSSTNFLPFLSGSGEKRQLSKSRSTGFGS